jgi:hypothetical protein
MGPEWLFALTPLAVAAGGWAGLRRKGLHRWLPSYAASVGRRRTPKPGEPVHLLICVCDHFEPKRGGVPAAVAAERVRRWVEEYPKQLDRFRDSAGRPPQHTFFYPAEEYEPEYLDALAGLCRAGYGDVEIHLHHDEDTAENLRRTLIDFKTTLHERHGLLRRDPRTGEVVYGFIHGNWALDNCRADGRHCGVDNELSVLVETGCYADFTLPSAPSETQTRTINQLYWAVGRPGKRKSHDTGVPVPAGPKPPGALLMIPGPLVLDWTRPKFGLLPRIENGCLQGSQPPTGERIDNWVRAGVEIPDSGVRTLAAKLHTHGAEESNMPVLFGEPAVRFHEALRERADRDPAFRYSYVTAWELAARVLSPGGERPTRIANGRTAPGGKLHPV